MRIQIEIYKTLFTLNTLSGVLCKPNNERMCVYHETKHVIK